MYARKRVSLDKTDIMNEIALVKLERLEGNSRIIELFDMIPGGSNTTTTKERKLKTVVPVGSR